MSPFGITSKSAYMKQKKAPVCQYALVPTGRNTFKNVKVSPKNSINYWQVLPSDLRWRYTKSHMKALDRMMALDNPVLIPKYGYNAALPKGIKRKGTTMSVPKKYNRGLSSGSAANSDTDYSDSASDIASDISQADFHHDLMRHFAIAADLPPKPRKPSTKLSKTTSIPKPKRVMRVLNEEEKTARRFGVPLALPVKQSTSLPKEKPAEAVPLIKESSESQAKDITNSSADTTLSCPGQLQFECTRCFILYSSLEQIELHIGQFHIRQEDGCPVFQLSEDNFDSLVCVKWDAIAAPGNSGSATATGSSANVTSNAVAQQLMPPPPVWYRPSVSFTAPTTLPRDTSRYRGNVTAISPPRSVEPVSDSASSTTDSFISTADWSFSLDAEIALALESANHKALQIQDVPPKRAYKKKKVILKLKEKRNIVVKTRKVKNTVRKKDREAGGDGNEVGEQWYASNTVRKVRLGLQERGGEKLRGGKHMRKCRSVYGIMAQDQWCNMCKWKKRCSRFGHQSEE